MAILSKQKWFRFYDCSTKALNPRSDAYYVALFSALPVLSFEKVSFENSGMGRELIMANIDLGSNRSILIGTSHLESLPQFKKIRVAQLDQSLEKLASESEAVPNCVGAVFMGDTNLFSGDLQSDDGIQSVKDYHVAIAKSSRSACRLCKEKIAKDSVRIAKRVAMEMHSGKDSLQRKRQITSDHWFHTRCFFKREEWQVISSGADISLWLTSLEGYNSLKKNQQESLLEDAGAEPLSEDNASEKRIAMAQRGLAKNWYDCWLMKEGNHEDNGYTFDGEANALVSNRKYRSRFDRVLFHPHNVHDKMQPAKYVKQIKLIGTKEISPGIFPSDHFGLHCVFDIEVKE